MQGNNFPGTQRGLTLIECCITLAIVSILAGTAAPSFIESNKKRVLDGSAGELVTPTCTWRASRPRRTRRASGSASTR